MNSRFYFATCQVGAEKAVKAEVLSEFPHLKFAFSRPGLITFKETDRDQVIGTTHGIFTRLWGEVVGQVKERNLLEGLLENIPQNSIVHIFERDTFVPGDDPENFVANAKINSIKSSLSAELQARFRWNAIPKLNETVYDLFWVDDFHVFLGKHTHIDWLDPSPGNQPQIPLPPDSPSRAYLKIVEAIHRFKPKFEKGQQVLEVGCSPGGASTAMISSGLQVTGVDPKRMHESLWSNKSFNFIQKTALEVTENDLFNVNPDWVVMDMNIAPLEAIDELAHALGVLRRNFGPQLKIKYGFLTIKLNDWKFAESTPLYLKRIKESGFKNVTATQLCSNRQEFFVFAEGFK